MGIFSKLMSTKEAAGKALEEVADKKIIEIEGVDIIDLDSPDIGRYEDDMVEITPVLDIKAGKEYEESTNVEVTETSVLTVPTQKETDETDSLAMAAEALLQGTISVGEKLEGILQEKEKVAASIENLLSGREKMLKGKTYCQQLNKKKSMVLSKTFEEYVDNDDFKDLPKKFYVMEVLKDTVPEIYTQPDIPATELRMALEHVHEMWEDVEREKEILKTEGDTLRNEITQFASVVNEMKNKHKLSADWEGKKQPLMTMQGKLATRRDAYMKKELIMDKKILELSCEYKELQIAFGEHSAYFAEVLGTKAETFVKDPGRAKKLQELLKKKRELEKQENELKHL